MGRMGAETSIEGTPRCGRCAEILPDETLSYCPSCGVPFSRIPPTNTYLRFEEHRHALFERRRQVALFALGSGIALIAFALLLLIDAVTVGRPPRTAGFTRPVHFHFVDVPGYPVLPLAVKREAVNVAIQAFEDHFGGRIDRYDIINGEPPAELRDFLRGGAADLTDFATWETRIFPEAERQWSRDSTEPLPVLITNLPITIRKGTDPVIETRHLSHSKLVSGLGHPALVIVSSYRMLTEDPAYRESRFETRSDGERARLLGEYLLAHEMGHALVGLGDYVVTAPHAPETRSPASIGRRATTTDANPETHYPPAYAECLMHTDEAGGFAAWKLLSERPLGRPSRCREYDTVLEAYRNRDDAWKLLKDGERVRAEALHARAIDQARQGLSPWAVHNWEIEHRGFLSPLARWMNSFHVFQSKHDQL
jgi:hypothetical protein